MKLIKHLMIIALVVSLGGCDKHEIEYNSEFLPGNMAEIQLHYFVPVASVATNYVNKVEINNQLVANSTHQLATYNAIPSGGIGRFYSIPSGTVNIKLYQGTGTDTNPFVLVYDKNTTISAGKYNVFVHDFDKEPTVLDNLYPYPTVESYETAQSTWVRFYNFLYETNGIPTDLVLQYQYQYTMNWETKEKSEWLNVGSPVAFGEATNWEHLHLIKEVFNSQGSGRIDYRILVKGADGNFTDLLKVSANESNYSDWWTATVGRCIHHIFAGVRTGTTYGVKVFSAR